MDTTNPSGAEQTEFTEEQEDMILEILKQEADTFITLE